MELFRLFKRLICKEVMFVKKIPSILLCLCALLALTACGHQPSVPYEDAPASPHEAPASSPAEEPTKPVEFGTGAVSAGVELPADWEYELLENTDGLLSGIRIWPAASSEAAAINEPLSAEGAQAAPPAAVNNGLTGAEAQQALTVILSLTDTCA